MEKARILIVDDVPANRELLSDFLEDLGHQAETAEDGGQALAMIREAPPSLVLLDIAMPGIDGYEVLATLKDSEDHRHIPVIMISGQGDREHVIKCIQEGAEDFLPKPFDPDLLGARVRASLERKALRDREQALLVELQTSLEALRVAESSRDALTNMIVHDLNSPLSVIQMNAEMLALRLSMGTLHSDNARGSVEKISDASETLARLVQGILDIARFEGGQMAVTLALVDLDLVARDLAESFSYQADERGFRIEVVPSDGGASVFADDSLLRRMVQNLISNALKYAVGGSYVRITVETRGGGAAILVSDDGPGIPEKALGRIFDKYYQAAPQGGQIRHFGIGLGLVFCRLAADAQGARLTVESAVGEGTTFAIAFGETPEN